jgi:N utilization substance protein A
MKNEFMLAFNEICEARGLSKEVVIEALKTALISAYRRDINISNTQDIAVDIDQRTGEPTIYAEKEVVESIMTPETEVLLSVAQQGGYPDAELGETVMMESTPENFGKSSCSVYEKQNGKSYTRISLPEKVKSLTAQYKASAVKI